MHTDVMPQKNTTHTHIMPHKYITPHTHTMWQIPHKYITPHTCKAPQIQCHTDTCNNMHTCWCHTHAHTDTLPHRKKFSCTVVISFNIGNYTSI